MPTPTAPPMFIGMNPLPVSGISYLTNPNYSFQDTNNDAVYMLNARMQLYSCNSYDIWAGGTNQSLTLNQCANAAVVDVGKGLHLTLTGTDVNMKLYDFQNDKTAKITFLNEGFINTSMVMNNLSSDHDGGTMLTMPGGWSIEFRGDTSLSAANFNVIKTYGR
jgi:hypothetical protein